MPYLDLPPGTIIRHGVQGSHTIPKELFLKTDAGGAAAARARPEAIKTLEKLIGYDDLNKFLFPPSSINLQPLPAQFLVGGSAIHNGNHSGYTKFVQERL